MKERIGIKETYIEAQESSFEPRIARAERAK